MVAGLEARPMGMFDIFLSPEKRIARHIRRLTNRDSQPEDRQASAEWLANHGTPQAVLGLLSRFDMQLDHDLKNLSEREIIRDLVIGLGDQAVEPLKAWLPQCKAVIQPLELLVVLKGERAAVQACFEILRREHEQGNDFKPAKKKAVLIWLAEHPTTDLVEHVVPFLEDFDEGVRYAAAEALGASGNDAGREPLLAALANPSEESNRFRARICDVFIQRGWSVQERADALPDLLPTGYAVRGERIVRA